jgi:4-aminobutyrate aminotransferase/(S)-3-amino-2-methylpropionate transaminase
MGPRRAPAASRIAADVPAGSIVYQTGVGSNVVDVDGNRYVDLAAGFGALLTGHGHPAILRVLGIQAARLTQALGDVYPSDAKIALLERLSRLYPEPRARVIVGQSGADAVTAALKTAVLATGKPGVVAFHGAYHGLSYAPLAACGLRESYRSPFVAQLGAHVTFVDYPADDDAAEYPGGGSALANSLSQVQTALSRGDVGAVLVEPVLGRGGVVVPPQGFLVELAQLTRKSGALLIADEIWTGLGRAGKLLCSVGDGVVPDVVCLGKGLGGGLPLSACIGSESVMSAWQRDDEVVHTSTFAGAPLACATAIATLDVISREKLVSRSESVGARFLAALREALIEGGVRGVRAVRGAGMMIGVDLGERPGAATALMQGLLRQGYIVSTGGGAREILVLTPPLTIAEPLLTGFVDKLVLALRNAPP